MGCGPPDCCPGGQHSWRTCVPGAFGRPCSSRSMTLRPSRRCLMIIASMRPGPAGRCGGSGWSWRPSSGSCFEGPSSPGWPGGGGRRNSGSRPRGGLYRPVSFRWAGGSWRPRWRHSDPRFRRGSLQAVSWPLGGRHQGWGAQRPARPVCFEISRWPTPATWAGGPIRAIGHESGGKVLPPGADRWQDKVLLSVGGRAFALPRPH